MGVALQDLGVGHPLRAGWMPLRRAVLGCAGGQAECQAAGRGSRLTAAAGPDAERLQDGAAGNAVLLADACSTRTGNRPWRASSNALVRPSPNARPAVAKSTDGGRASSSAFVMLDLLFMGLVLSFLGPQLADLRHGSLDHEYQLPNFTLMTSESTNLREFLVLRARRDTVTGWTSLSPAALSRKASGPIARPAGNGQLDRRSTTWPTSGRPPDWPARVWRAARLAPVGVSAAERSWDGKRIKKFDAERSCGSRLPFECRSPHCSCRPRIDGTAVRYVLTFRRRRSRAWTTCCRLCSRRSGRLTRHGCLPEEGHRGRGKRARVDNLETARRVLELAQRTADEAIEAARGAADETLGMARSETEVLLAKASRQAEQITGDAVARAEALELDAQERHRQAMGRGPRPRGVRAPGRRPGVSSGVPRPRGSSWKVSPKTHGRAGRRRPRQLAEMRVRAAGSRPARKRRCSFARTGHTSGQSACR